MSKCVPYVILLLSILCLFVMGSAEKNTLSLINSMSIETKNPDPGTAVSISIPAIYATNKPSNIFVLGAGKKTLQKTISPEEAKGQSSAGYCIDRNASSSNSSSNDCSLYSSSDLSSDCESFSGNSIYGINSGLLNTTETIPISESAPTYTIQNLATDVTCRGFPTSSILTAGDMIHYQINVTNKVNCSLTNVTLTDPVVIFMGPEESISEDGILEPNETWTYTGSYIVSQHGTNNNGNGSGIIENTATADCDQFDPISSTATVPITVLSALSTNETTANVGLRGNYNVRKPGDFLTYEAVVTSTGKTKLASPIIAGSPITIFTKDGKVPFEVLSPGNSWTPGGKYNATLDNMSNNGISNIVSAAGAAHDQVNPQSSRVNTHKYRIIQPVSPSRKYNYLNTSYLGESSHYVGADGHTITLVNNESAVDPSYKQLVEFIKEDKTNEIPYNNTSFVCSDASERVHNNAEAIGFRSAWVYIDFTNERATINPLTNALVVGHACNLFNTTDKGLVAIDCTGGSCPTDAAASIDLSKWDNEVSLVKNGEYTPRLLYSFKGSNKLKEFSSMGTIANFYVFW